jgi:hypothetical protein
MSTVLFFTEETVSLPDYSGLNHRDNVVGQPIQVQGSRKLNMSHETNRNLGSTSSKKKQVI